MEGKERSAMGGSDLGTGSLLYFDIPIGSVNGVYPQVRSD